MLYWISEVENQIFLFADHTEKLKVQELNVRSTLSGPHDLRMASFKVLKWRSEKKTGEGRQGTCKHAF